MRRLVRNGGCEQRLGPLVLAGVAVAIAAAALAGCTASATGGTGSGTGTAPKHPPSGAGPAPILLGHSGRWLTNAVGQVVELHGLNMIAKVPPYEPEALGFGAAAARSLAGNGFDVVRLGVIYSAVEPQPGVFSAAYVASIGRTVAALARRGVYSLLDFHQDQMSVGFGGEGFPSWSVDTGGLPIKHFVFPLGYTGSPALGAAFDNFWSDRPGPGGVGVQERYAAAWRYVAARFAGDPWVLGYDLFNEPWPAHATDAQLGAFYSRVIAAIRTVDRRHLVFYEPFVLFDFGQPTTLPRFAGADLGMSFHDYCAANASAEPAVCARNERLPVANALARSSATGDALVEAEFGSTDNLADLSRVTQDADAAGISWIEWAYCGCEDPTGTIPPSIEALVTDPALPATGSNVDAAKLAVLSEPYARAVSGTPESSSFDTATHTFRFSYSARAPDGHVFGPGSCTAVLVPPLQYPHGYRATVVGARVTSAPGAGVLTLVRAGSGESGSLVTVEVRPAASGSQASAPTASPIASAISSCR
jgi:endoglycosylceramidase